MPYLQLDLSALRDFEESALGVLFRDLSALRGTRLTPEEVREMYANGITLALSGDGLGRAAELNYALYYRRMSAVPPAVLTLVCYAASGQSHDEILRRDRPHRLIVAGTLNNGSFSGVSTTWLKLTKPASGRHALGLFMNQLLLSAYGIGGPANRAQAVTWSEAAS